LRTGPVTIRPDDRWRSTAPRTTRYVAAAIAAPWLHRYGYRLRDTAGRTVHAT
jgi:hypothetical protein